jgi:hypothetical protein
VLPSRGAKGEKRPGLLWVISGKARNEHPPGQRAYGLPGAFSRHNQSRSVVFRQQIPAMSARRLVRGNNILRRSLPCERVVKFLRRRRRRCRFMKRQLQKSLNAKRSVVITRHKTSVSLEDAFWKSFNEIAASRNMTLGSSCHDRQRSPTWQPFLGDPSFCARPLSRPS